MPDELMDEAGEGGHEMVYAWHRSKAAPDDAAEWEEIQGIATPRYVLTAA